MSRRRARGAGRAPSPARCRAGGRGGACRPSSGGSRSRPPAGRTSRSRRRRGSRRRARARARPRRTTRGSRPRLAAAAPRTARRRRPCRGSRRAIDAGVASRSSVTSAPAENARPSPAITTARLERSSSEASASPRARSTAVESALSFAGRRSVSRQTSPRRSLPISPSVATPSPCHRERLGAGDRLVPVVEHQPELVLPGGRGQAPEPVCDALENVTSPSIPVRV